MNRPCLVLASCCIPLLMGGEGHIEGIVCLVGFLGLVLAVIVGWVRVLTRGWRQKPYIEADVPEPQQRREAEVRPPPTVVYYPRKQYGWPVVFGGIGAFVGLLYGIAGLARLEERDPDSILGFLMASAAMGGAAGLFLGGVIRFMTKPNR